MLGTSTDFYRFFGYPSTDFSKYLVAILSVQLGKRRQSGRVFVTLAPRSDPCLFCGLAIEWGVRLLNELIKVKRNVLMVCQEAPALLDESQAQFWIYARPLEMVSCPLISLTHDRIWRLTGDISTTLLFTSRVLFWGMFLVVYVYLNYFMYCI